VACGSVADGASADEVADFFGDVLGVVSGALQRLRHQQDVNAVWSGAARLVLEMAEKNQIANAVDLAIAAQDGDGGAQVARTEGVRDLAQHRFNMGIHLDKVGDVLHIETMRNDAAAADKRGDEISDPLEVNHAFQAGEQLAHLLRRTLRQNARESLIHVTIEFVQLLLAVEDRLRECRRADGIRRVRHRSFCKLKGTASECDKAGVSGIGDS